MTELPLLPESESLPEPKVDKSHPWLPSLVWLVPLVAALVGIGLVVQLYLQQGILLSLNFNSAEGIEAGKTRVKYKEVEIGLVKEVTLSADRRKTLIKIELKKDAGDFADRDSRFWIVRPRVAIGGVSGLSTLLSGAYIGVDIGHSGERKTVFTGLEVPPLVTSDLPGRRFRLVAEDLGSLDIGSPVLYRRIPVGQVVAYQMNPDGKGLELQIFIQSPFDQFVRDDSRFWQASGIDLSFDANGIKLNTQSLTSLIQGGISFDATDAESPVAEAGKEFRLMASQQAALKEPDSAPEKLRVYFQQSLRGLTVGAPVDFRGLTLGEVTGIELEYQPEWQQVKLAVMLQIFPSRLGKQYAASFLKLSERAKAEVLEQMVSRGLRAQLRTGNLLTGQLYVALDFMPDAPQVRFNAGSRPLELPAVAGDLDQLQSRLASLLQKLDSIPFDSLSQELGNSLKSLNTGLKSADKLLKTLDSQVAPELATTMKTVKTTLLAAQLSLAALQQGMASDAPLLQDARITLQELAKAARSMKTLTDYLDRHPEALLQGKKEP